jgi:hypothetical protein
VVLVNQREPVPGTTAEQWRRQNLLTRALFAGFF